MKISQLKNKTIAILGYGREGKSTLDFLMKLGVKDITVLDSDKLKDSEISSEGQKTDIKYILGNSYLDNLDEYDVIIKSPGISPYNPKIKPFIKKLTSQTEIFFRNYETRVIGISGTKGKSTTTTLINQALELYGYNTKIVGNIGAPVLDQIDILSEKKYDYVVYELSSYMLENFKPKCFISVLVNIYADHLDWHENIENYRQAKLNLLENSITSIVNSSIKDVDNIESIKTFGKTGDYYYKGHNFYINSKKVFDDKKVLLKGEHNKSNITGVLGVLDTIGIKDFSKFENLLKNFSGLPHRLQNIGTYGDITFIDDAISTTPESTIEAIKTFKNDIDTIFLGGTDRGYDFVELITFLEQHNICNIVLFPDSGKRIKNLLNNNFNFIETSSMKDAVDFAFKYTKKGKICLLSTASPSYSLWKNFEHKGEDFKNEIINYIK